MEKTETVSQSRDRFVVKSIVNLQPIRKEVTICSCVRVLCDFLSQNEIRFNACHFITGNCCLYICPSWVIFSKVFLQWKHLILHWKPNKKSNIFYKQIFPFHSAQYYSAHQSRSASIPIRGTFSIHVWNEMLKFVDSVRKSTFWFELKQKMVALS